MPARSLPSPGDRNAKLITIRAPRRPRDTSMYQRPHARLMLGEMTTCEGRIRLVRSRHLRRETTTAVSDVGQLVRDAAAGDQAAWDRLVERFNGPVWSVAR